MVKQRKHLYFHKKTGNIMHITRTQAKKIGPEWEEIEFTTNEKGERVMRFKFDGATVDVQESEKVEVDANGKPVTD